MPLQLKTAAPDPLVVKLAGGATVNVRPATAFERDIAIARVGKMLAGLIDNRESAQSAAELLGLDLDGGLDVGGVGFLDAAARRLVLIDLATTCVIDWTGIVDDAGVPIAKPSRGALALLLRDTETAARIERAVQLSFNVEVAEKNVSAASPNGAAAADETIAQNVADPASAAPAA